MLRNFSRLIKQQCGNAVLFSLIIMSAAMTISLGMASLVAGEVRSAGLVLPAERAYYKSESFVEQALWQKKVDSNFEVKDVAQLNSAYPNFLCAATNCFSSSPRSQAELLKKFYATAAPPQDDTTLLADTTQQYDIVTTGANGSGSVDLSDITGQAGFQGLEVTVVSFPKAAASVKKFPVDDPSTAGIETPVTPVFVDKILIPASASSKTIQINAALKNTLGESYPPLNTNNNYRLRIKALGANATADVKATSGGTTLTLRSPDFAVQSVADDAKSRRGIQVLFPATERTSSIFDFVLFSDLDLSKLEAKVQGTKLISASAYQDNDGDCVRDATDPALPGVQMSAQPNVGNAIAGTTNANGTATFPNLQAGVQYTVSATATSGMLVCNNNQSVSFQNNNTNETKQLSFLIKLPPRVPWYRLYNYGYVDHFYTADYNEMVYWSTHGYTYETVAGYLYNIQVPGTQPLYRSWNGAATTHYYTMSKALHDYWDANGYVDEGVTGYLDPFTGSCPTGSAPLYESWYPPGDHLYTMNLAEYNSVTWYVQQGIVGCMWTTDGQSGSTD